MPSEAEDARVCVDRDERKWRARISLEGLSVGDAFGERLFCKNAAESIATPRARSGAPSLPCPLTSRGFPTVCAQTGSRCLTSSPGGLNSAADGRRVGRSCPFGFEGRTTKVSEVTAFTSSDISPVGVSGKTC